MKRQIGVGTGEGMQDHLVVKAQELKGVSKVRLV